MNAVEEIITKGQEIIYNIRVQNYHEASLRFQVFLKMIQNNHMLFSRILNKEDIFFELLQQMFKALEKEDMLLLGDLLEGGFLPILKEMLVPEKEKILNGYIIESTASGHKTIRNIDTDLYLHSNENPMEEARILVEHCYDPFKQEYAVWGCGLGYHIFRLFEEARGAIHIKVFDEDFQVIDLAKKYGIINKIPNKNLVCIWDKTGEKFAQCIENKNMGILIHLPSVKKISDKRLKDALYDFFASWNGIVQYKKELIINFRCNVQNCYHNVDELKSKLENKEIIIVGGGPSLDDGIKYLSQQMGKKKIIAVTTVFKKLLLAGIIPDYIIAMDSQQRTFSHLKGLEKEKIPLIIDSTTYWEFADKYSGVKYITYQKNYVHAEKMAEKNKNKLYETGGSVVTLALDIALNLSVKAVYLIGIDLAYPNGISHADNTMDCRNVDVSEMKMVEDVNGNKVATDYLLDSYRRWMERKIRKYPEIPVYNLSGCGANIAGTKRMLTYKI